MTEQRDRPATGPCFLMRPTGQAHEPENETASVCWVATPDRTREMLGETTNAGGRERYLELPEVALELDSEIRSSPEAQA